MNRIASLLASAALGCSSADFDGSLDGAPEDTGLSPDGPVADTADLDDSASGIDPDARWGVEGALVIADGEIDVTRTSLELKERGPDPCDGPLHLLNAVLAQPPYPEAGMHQWWELAIGEPPPPADSGLPADTDTDAAPDTDPPVDTAVPPTCAPTQPRRVFVGLGETSPAQQPAADRAGVRLKGSLGLFLGISPHRAVLAGLAVAADSLPPDDTDTAPPEDTDTAPPGDTDTAPPEDTDAQDTDAAERTDLDGVWRAVMLHATPYR